MALSRVKTWGAEALLFADQNAEFDNILNNALALVSPWTGNMSAGGYRLTGLGLGTAGSPSLQFTSDTDTGIFSSGANTLDLATAGTSWATLSSVGVLTMNGTTGALRLHNLTTTQRNALTPVSGMVIYNTTSGRAEVREASAWRDFGGVAFDAITAATNTTAAMVLGSGSSLATSGTGYINQAGTGTSAAQMGGRTFVAFLLEIKNNAGTIQHRFVQDTGNATAPVFTGYISGTSATFQNTPTVDASTDFVAGGGLRSGSLYEFVLNDVTGSLQSAVSVFENTSGLLSTIEAPTVYATNVSTNVNGTTQTRHHLSLRSSSGSTIAINTTNITGTVGIRVMGYW